MKNLTIKNIFAQKILDSRGNWTVKAKVITQDGYFEGSVPSGASKGKYEAKTIDVDKAIEIINKVFATKLKGKKVTEQKNIDKFLNPQKFGANSTLAVSLAVCRAGAKSKGLPLYKYIAQISENKTSLKLPFPCFNIINGGVHAGNELDFQEFMIVFREKSFYQNLSLAIKIYHELKKIIKEKFIDLAINLGDEGGFAPPILAPEEAIDLILEAGEKLGLKKKIKIIIDVASSQFYKRGKYKMKIGSFTKEELIKYYLVLIKKYPILGLEDPFAENDWQGWQKFCENLKGQNKKLLIIGDDLLVTNPKRIKRAREKKACNSAIIKINQIGNLSKAICAVKLAKSFGWKIVVSHRSGETTDDFISDFAVGVGADFIKSGAPARGERVVKYNRLLEIANQLNKI